MKHYRPSRAANCNSIQRSNWRDWMAREDCYLVSILKMESSRIVPLIAIGDPRAINVIPDLSLHVASSNQHQFETIRSDVITNPVFNSKKYISNQYERQFGKWRRRKVAVSHRIQWQAVKATVRGFSIDEFDKEIHRNPTIPQLFHIRTAPAALGSETIIQSHHN